MARSRKGLQQKVEEFRKILEHYGGIPSQQQDRAAYANICYYIKTYGDTPEMQELISEFNLDAGKRGKKRVNAETQISNIAEILREKGRIPSVNEDESLYTKIRYVFHKHQDVYEVIKLKYIYAHSSCFPLPNTTYGPKPEDPNSSLWFGIGFVPDNIIEWIDNTTYEYIEYVYAHFREFPGLETKPMVRLQKKIRSWNIFMGLYMRKGELDRLKAFVQRMVELGCNETLIKDLYYSFKFASEQVQERVRQMVIENGACAIHYIAQTAIPEYALNDTFVYRYYYTKFKTKKDSIYRMPLGTLPAYSIIPNMVLRVHYRDYYKCDINRIRESAKSHYRNWKTLQPETIDEWKYFGQCAFFEDSVIHLESSNSNILMDWSATYIEKQQSIGKEYFTLSNDDVYRDYCDYLIENGYRPQSRKLLDVYNRFASTDKANGK